MNHPNRPAAQRRLRDDARAIWEAGVDAVRADRLVRGAVRVEDRALVVCDERYPFEACQRIAVVGAGKAGAGMAVAVEQALAGTPLAERLEGWVNVPADCVRATARIHLHAARPAQLNEPTEAGVEGAGEILRIVSRLAPDDLCMVLLSGGGSALLPAPKPPITLSDKQAVTRALMHSQATIDQLNTVRKRLSLIKGGGLARATTAGHLVALIISDVVGDRLATIASGPTWPDTTTDAEALAVLEQFAVAPPAIPQRVIDSLRPGATEGDRTPTTSTLACRVTNQLIGSNAIALEAAANRGRELGYQVVSLGSDGRGEASQEGRDLARRCLTMLADRANRPAANVCLVGGGEPVVDMTAIDRPGHGGRNQQLALAAVTELQHVDIARIALLSGGTDGEDGPTDAAGALVDAELIATAHRLQVDPEEYLQRLDAYNFFAQCGGLLVTGPTHTNVMDLRVAVVRGDQ